MTQPTDRTFASIQAAYLQGVEATRAVLGQTLTVVALASYAAGGAVLLLMCVDAVSSAMASAEADWPGQYWFAVVPLVVAGLTLQLGAARLVRPRPVRNREAGERGAA